LESKLEYFKDPNFVFDEASHSYSYLNPVTGRPVQMFQSVTGFLGQFKKPFDSDMIAGMVAKKRGTAKKIILAEWKEISDIALTLGTNVHKWIEDYYNGLNPAMPTDERELDRVYKFLALYDEKLHKFTPVHQEFRVFSRKWGLAGTLEMKGDMLETGKQIRNLQQMMIKRVENKKCYTLLMTCGIIL